jgi:hypothetical protein
MRSENADYLKRALIEQARRMTPVQRVRAFIEHSDRMRSIRDAGARACDRLLAKTA